MKVVEIMKAVAIVLVAKMILRNGCKIKRFYIQKKHWQNIMITHTSYGFEKAAKNAVIQTLSENISIDQLDLVWFAHELGYKKCTIWGQPMGNRYAEVTYNRDKDEMYVDIYQKIINNKISSDEFNFET